MAVETVQRNAPPLQNSERGTVDLFGMHDHRRTELHLADLAESYRLCKTREEQGGRVGTAEISGSDSWNQEKEHDSGNDDPDRGPQTHASERYRNVLCLHRQLSHAP